MFVCNIVTAYQEAVRVFRGLDPVDMAGRSGAKCEGDLLLINYFGREHVVDRAGRVTLEGKPVSYNDKTLILQYLCSASGLPPRGKWLSFLELPSGSHHYGPFQADGTAPLARRFGQDTGVLHQAAQKLGGQPIEVGDVGYRIPALPKLPLAVILWEGDEEFPAQANILFDSVAPTHLSTAALWVLGVELATKLLAEVDVVAAKQQQVDWLGR